MIIPAYRGEFGLKVRFHVPVIYARGSGHVIEIEEGEEALYPLAKEWRIVPRAHDDARHGSPPERYSNEPVKRFRPEPHVRQALGPQYDVCICPRKRNYVEAKNWPHWQRLVDVLTAAGGVSVFAGGVADASFTNLGVPAAWHWERPLDATIQAMRSAKIVVAACSGLAHLAVLCGAPLLLFAYRGRVSPGPIYNSSGRFVSKENRLIPLEKYYLNANHTGSMIQCLMDGWEDPQQVGKRALEVCHAAVGT